MSMGNPDGATPAHIVEKLVEAATRPDTHGYSVSKGIPRLRRAVTNWYERRYNVHLDPDSEAIVTIGSKEGLAHLMLATPGQGRHRSGAQPQLPDSYIWCRHCRREYPFGAHGPRRGLFRGNRKSRARVHSQAQNDDSGFSQQSDGPVCGTVLF
uniref:Aminotransferase class I/classII domain-containing protein n=1 Tax=Panagrolaimus superbus TaxID=310955 RepID=A0A914YSB6_9BILA